MIIVTGASSGIGKFIFDYYISRGESVLGIYNKTEPISNCSSYLKLDLQDLKQIEDFVESRELKDVVLINSAGISIAGMAHKQSVFDFTKTLDINVTAVFTMIRYLLPIMRKQGYGRIINISSVVPKIGTPGNVAYATSKAALWGMSKVIAIENAKKGITSNCINLGYCDTGMTSSIPNEILDSIKKKIPTGELCPLDNIINAVDFLVKSDYVTGAEINLNGGLY